MTGITKTPAVATNLPHICDPDGVAQRIATDMIHTCIRLSLLLFVALTLGACAEPDDRVLHLSGAWVRTPPPGAAVAAGFVALRNPGDEALTIRAVQADLAARAEIHDMDMQDGVMRMRHLADGLTLAPGESLALAPGGKHLMLFDLQRPLQDGDTLHLKLLLADGRELEAAFPVQDGAP